MGAALIALEHVLVLRLHLSHSNCMPSFKILVAAVLLLQGSLQLFNLLRVWNRKEERKNIYLLKISIVFVFFLVVWLFFFLPLFIHSVKKRGSRRDSNSGCNKEVFVSSPNNTDQTGGWTAYSFSCCCSKLVPPTRGTKPDRFLQHHEMPLVYWLCSLFSWKTSPRWMYFYPKLFMQ